MLTFKKNNGYDVKKIYRDICKEFYYCHIKKFENDFIFRNSPRIIYRCYNYTEYYQEDLLQVLESLEFYILPLHISKTKSIENIFKDGLKELISAHSKEGITYGTKVGIATRLKVDISKKESLQTSKDAPKSFEGILREFMKNNPRLIILFPNAQENENKDFDSFAEKTLNSRSTHEWKILIILVISGEIKNNTLKNDWNLLDPNVESTKYCEIIYNSLDDRTQRIFDGYAIFLQFMSMTKGSIKLLRDMFNNLQKTNAHKIDRCVLEHLKKIISQDI